MKPLFICVFLISGQICFGQPKAQDNYLLVRFDQLYDGLRGSNYYIIKAENGGDSTSEVYLLKYYDNNKKAINTGAGFYSVQKNSSEKLYNYFSSPTEAINFLAKDGWTLVSIYTELSSGYDNQRNGAGDIVPVTTVSSRPVFCFKK